jgi:RES domain-containing protein
VKIDPHPDFPNIASRLEAVGRNLEVTFAGDLFRFINPTFSKPADIVSGKGAWHAAGRWNLAKSAALSYSSTTPETALAEALAHVKYFSLPVATALPRVLVALNLKVTRALDLRDGKVRQILRIAEAMIQGLDWRAKNQHREEALTQAWGRAFLAAGLEAVIVPSAADARGTNVLVFPENLQSASRFDVKDKVKWPRK